MVPRTGPFSASSALLQDVLVPAGEVVGAGGQHRLFGHVRQGTQGSCAACVLWLVVGPLIPTDLIENISDLAAGISIGKPSRFVSYGDRRTGPPRPAPRARDRGRAASSSRTASRRFLAGEIDDDAFRVFRLNQGIYGQRQGGYNQMLRVKIPYGKVEPDQLEMLALHRRDLLPRLGPPHHPPERAVPLRAARRQPARRCASSRRSGSPAARRAATPCATCAGCHLAGACPYEVLDISPWAEATKDLFLRNPIAQRMPRKFKINFSGCATDCGQAMFNDVGVVAVSRPLPDGTVEPGFQRVHGGRPRRQPAPGHRARGVHLARRPPPHDRGDPAGRRTTTATATTSCGRA